MLERGYYMHYLDVILKERDRLIVVGILILFSLIFEALFEQAGSSLNILTDRGVDRVIFGWEVPASMFQSLNAGFIFTIAPLFAMLADKRLQKEIWSPLRQLSFQLVLFLLD